MSLYRWDWAPMGHVPGIAREPFKLPKMSGVVETVIFGGWPPDATFMRSGPVRCYDPRSVPNRSIALRDLFIYNLLARLGADTKHRGKRESVDSTSTTDSGDCNGSG